MRTTNYALTLAAAALTFVSACTVKDVDTPPLAGPSTFAHSITMVADRDTLTQNGSDFTDIRITSLGPTGQSENIPLRAQVLVDGVAQDYGTLSSKSPITPTTIRYTAPAASTIAAGQVPQTVTIEVTPSTNGDFRSEFARQVSIRLVPQGIILPTNPNLVADFALPANPKVLDVLTFDASTSTNNGAACGVACIYSWSFGDGTTGSGQVTSHQFRAVGTYQVTLTVTDVRGAQAFKTSAVVVAPGTPPTAAFTFSPTPVPVNVDIFFNASDSKPAAGSGRTLVSYGWTFGDGTSGTGVTVTHRFQGAGKFTTTLTVTDDAQASAQKATEITVGPITGPQPVAALAISPAAPKVGRVVLDASASTPSTGSTIVSYKFDFGDNSPQETSTNPVQSHIYGVGNYVASVEVTDSNGKVSTKTAAFTVTP